MPNDVGWSPWSVECGWTMGQIPIGLYCGLLRDRLLAFTEGRVKTDEAARARRRGRRVRHARRRRSCRGCGARRGRTSSSSTPRTPRPATAPTPRPPSCCWRRGRRAHRRQPRAAAVRFLPICSTSTTAFSVRSTIPPAPGRALNPARAGGLRILVLSLCGQVFMGPADNPLHRGRTAAGRAARALRRRCRRSPRRGDEREVGLATGLTARFRSCSAPTRTFRPPTSSFGQGQRLHHRSGDVGDAGGVLGVKSECVVSDFTTKVHMRFEGSEEFRRLRRAVHARHRTRCVTDVKTHTHLQKTERLWYNRVEAVGLNSESFRSKAAETSRCWTLELRLKIAARRVSAAKPRKRLNAGHSSCD